MSVAPPGWESPPPPPEAAPVSHKELKAKAAAASAYAKAQRPWYKMKRWWAAGLLLCAIIGAAASGTSSESQLTVSHNTTQAARSEDPAAAKGPTFKNGVLTTPDLKIQITRVKVIKAGQKGNEYGHKPVIAFWYKTTNLSGDKVNPIVAFIPYFNAYQDNNPNAENKLDVGSLPDDRFLDSQSENIKKGGTVEDAIAYELDDLVTPVDLVATDGLDEAIGKATYALR